ncbi:hypothetical protein E2C01_098308 [Portunus trituberculatus]|uniref:Uncharacterized protein n=1 Tax=Portunus trituberculatus TaxID=210409 RepID=A0A5B7K6Q5_PORTR|nr:hypothetical protein [Portunus trituberculatus]
MPGIEMTCAALGQVSSLRKHYKSDRFRCATQTPRHPRPWPSSGGVGGRSDRRKWRGVEPDDMLLP